VTDEDDTVKTVTLAAGDALDFEAASSITAAVRARVVVIAGAEASGKTTLITSVYELFQNGPFAGFLFTGSQTLIGFEQRCYRARVASGALDADTERTTVGRPRLLHLVVRDARLEQPKRHLLITDVAGEAFRLARDSTTECQKLTILKRADTIVILLDGYKLAGLNTRSDAASDAFSLVRSCLDANMIGSTTNLTIVFTKWDDVQASGQAAIDYVDFLCTDASKRFGGRLQRLAFAKIAARPKTGRGIMFGFGCDTLFRDWADQLRGSVQQPLPHRHGALREIDRFAVLNETNGAA